LPTMAGAFLANIRSAYAEASAAALGNDAWTTDKPATDNTFTNYTYTQAADDGSTWAITIKATQKSTTNGTKGWANGEPNIGGKNVEASTKSYTVTVKADGTCTITSEK
jgi:hypothetical protein